MTQLLKKIFVWTGVQVQVPESGCKGPQGEKLFGQLLIDGKCGNKVKIPQQAKNN